MLITAICFNDIAGQLESPCEIQCPLKVSQRDVWMRVVKLRLAKCHVGRKFSSDVVVEQGLFKLADIYLQQLNK